MTDNQDPLPKEWLPEPLPPADDSIWEVRTAAILSAATPELRRLGVRDEAGAQPWVLELGRWWAPSGVLAAAAILVLYFSIESPVREAQTPSMGGTALQFIASDGDPVALWAALGVRADPVLALLTLEDHTAFGAPSDLPIPPREETR